MSQAQLDACSGQLDGTPCTVPMGTGQCDHLVCIIAVCGNGRIEPPEVCDDGNVTDEDATVAQRCSSNCRSTEVCGNGIVDLKMGEICDDGNLLDHDGCSSVCQPETASWAALFDPDPRYDAVAAFDVARAKVVMYGGTTSAPQTDVSEWDGVWRGKIAVVPPEGPRRSPAFAYFAPHGAVVVEGGGTGNGPATETWEWNGVTWKRLPDGPNREEHAMVYDSKRQRLVLFGGTNGGSDRGETFEFDGTSWTQITTPTSPSPREAFGMAYDPKRNVVVLFGGKSVGTPLSDTWEYDGHTWTQRFPSAMPIVAHSPLAYSSKAGGVVMVCGFDNGGTGGSTMYVWNGTTWASSATAIPARGWHALAEDGRGGLLVFGGLPALVGAAARGDTWRYDGAWTSVTPTPLPRAGYAAITAKDRVVLFGGASAQSTYPTDTWELTTRGWQQFPDGPLPNDAPPGTFLPQLAYDAAHAQVVMFGGLKNGSTPDDTTWKRIGSTWTSSHPTPSPSPRTFHALAYDVARAQIVLFGGAVASGLSNETWIFDGTTWSARTPAHSPQPRAEGAMAYDTVNNLVLLFGGGENVTGFTDLWAWDGTDWTDITPAGDHPRPSIYVRTLTPNPFRHSLLLLGVSDDGVFETWELLLAQGSWSWSQIRTIVTPPARQYHGAVLLPDQFTTVVLGGTGAAILADQWGFQLEGPNGHEACQLPIDVDGDGATLCDDPDCWPVCSPACPPASSCPSTSSRCGDGICDAAFETCHNCPADCTSCAPVCGDHACDSGEMTTCPGDCP